MKMEHGNASKVVLLFYWIYLSKHDTFCCHCPDLFHMLMLWFFDDKSSIFVTECTYHLWTVRRINVLFWVASG